MTRRQELDRHLVVLTEVKGILGAMKNLAMVEIRKLARMRAAHHLVVETVRAALADFLAFHPALRPAPAAGDALVLLAGSERGFCGNFNEMLLEAANRFAERREGGPPSWFAIGTKLASRLEGHPRLIESLPGPNAAEEVVNVLNGVLTSVMALRAKRGGFAGISLWVAFHDPEQGSVRMEELTAFPAPAAPPGHASRPYVRIEPARLLGELIEHYLFSALTRAFYASLTSENRFRLAHMENATRRVENRLAEMTMRRNILRQEEITQEVASILLSAESFTPQPR